MHATHNKFNLFMCQDTRDEQRKRFLERIAQPDKNWKLSLSDLTERHYWKQYRHAYEECLGTTSTLHSPWFIVPADDKANARLIISHIILEKFESLKMKYPVWNDKRRNELEAMKVKLLESE